MIDQNVDPIGMVWGDVTCLILTKSQGTPGKPRFLTFSNIGQR